MAASAGVAFTTLVIWCMHLTVKEMNLVCFDLSSSHRVSVYCGVRSLACCFMRQCEKVYDFLFLWIHWFWFCYGWILQSRSCSQLSYVSDGPHSMFIACFFSECAFCRQQSIRCRRGDFKAITKTLRSFHFIDGNGWTLFPDESFRMLQRSSELF